jgi:hypothetical protein
MRYRILAAALTLGLGSPAFAAGGLVCRTAGTQPIETWLVVSHTAVPTIVSARLQDNGRHVPVAVAQAWLEPNELRVDLVNRNATRHELRLRARRSGPGYDGTLWRNGQRRWVRCREG